MRVKFYTLGCKVNQYETQALVEEFICRGFELTKEPADLCIINTCSVTRRADFDSKKLVIKAKKENPQAKIAVCGCAVKSNKSQIKKIGADYIVEQEEKPSLVDIIEAKPSMHKEIWELKISNFFNQRAFVKIQDGCDNFCSFCKVPYLRGSSRSRPRSEILQEITCLAEKYKEIVLCGVNLGLYGKDFIGADSLSKLIADILEIKTLCRLRLSSLEPCAVTNDIIALFENPKLCPHLHLPFQSADDAVLGAMNKKETVAGYESIVEKLRKISPDIAISCDIITGFPAEDEKAFENTVSFIKRIEPMRMHIFTFSPREGTACAGSFACRSAKERYKILKEVSDTFAIKYKNKFIGRVLRMVTEEKKGIYVCGYTENYIRTWLKDDAKIGELVPVRIEKVTKDKVFASTIN